MTTPEPTDQDYLAAVDEPEPERPPHTPGPWGIEGVCIVGPTNQMRPYTNEDGTEDMHPSELIALVYSCGAHNLTANMRLIAAAPTMLKALKRIMEIAYLDEPLGERLEAIRDNARVAIALARKPS